MGKSPLTEKQVKSLRKLVSEKPLHELLLNIGIDLMLRGSDLLNLKVGDVMNESGTVKKEVQIKQKKTKKSTLRLPLSDNSIKSIKKHLSDKPLDEFIFKGQKSYTGKPISVIQYSRIVKQWMEMLGVEDTSAFSSHSIRKTKPTVIFNQTKNIDVCRRLLGHSSVTATQHYIGTTDNSALDVARNINI